MTNVTTSSGEGTTTLVSAIVQGGVFSSPQPLRGMFEVEVDGLLGFSLIPLNDLARDLASAWNGGTTRMMIVGQTQYAKSELLRVVKLCVTKEHGALLTNGGDPFYTGQSISADERTVALAAIEAHRESKRAKPAPKKRSRR